jgi:hypothetical protein
VFKRALDDNRLFAFFIDITHEKLDADISFTKR